MQAGVVEPANRWRVRGVPDRSDGGEHGVVVEGLAAAEYLLERGADLNWIGFVLAAVERGPR